MERKISIAFLIGILSFGCFSQTKTYVGIRGGGHLKSSFIDHTIFNFTFQDSFSPGIHTGLFIKHFPKKRDAFFNSGIQFGINYVQKGWHQKFESEFDEARTLPNYKVRMNYLEIPIEGIGYFGNKNKYFIAAGLLIEYLIASKVDERPLFDREVGVGDTNNAIDRVNFWNFATYDKVRDNTFGYGGRVSGGIFRDFAFGSLHIEGFFSYSFSNFIDAGNLTDPNLPDISNLWTAGASVAYLIPFGKLDLVKK